MEKEAKEAFFDELYQLDKEYSSEEDQSNASVILRQSRLARPEVSARTPRNEVVHSSRPEQPLLRTVSAPLPHPLASSRRQTNKVERSSFSSTASFKQSEQVIIDTPIMANKTADVIAQKEASKTIGKRKRGQSLELKSESQQIFNGLGFCESRALWNLHFSGHSSPLDFVPNNDTSIPRKLRIRKAMEWGALWVREWRDGVTHVIVDKALCYDDVLKALKISSLPVRILILGLSDCPADQAGQCKACQR